MAKVMFLPHNVEVECGTGLSVFQAAQISGVIVETACGGKGTCGLCRVTIKSGGATLSAPGFEEKKYIGTATNLRLSCRITPTEDLVVVVPPPRPPKKKK